VQSAARKREKGGREEEEEARWGHLNGGVRVRCAEEGMVNSGRVRARREDAGAVGAGAAECRARKWGHERRVEVVMEL